MEKNKMPFKVVLTGPESSGKTTLALQLAHELDTRLTPEFSRPYLQHLGRPYRYNDLKNIYLGQKWWEKYQALNCHKPILICDTDWTVIRIWEQFRFGTIAFTEHEIPGPNTHYFLCSPDMPWQPDPLRENAVEREVLFGLYLDLLTRLEADFTVLQGSEMQRLATALSMIQKFLLTFVSIIGVLKHRMLLTTNMPA